MTLKQQAVLGACAIRTSSSSDITPVKASKIYIPAFYGTLRHIWLYGCLGGLCDR